MCLSKRLGGLGIRNLEAFNMAMLAKQAWRLLHNPDTLLSRMLEARYFSQCNFLDAPLSSAPSYTWRSIWESRNLLQKGLRWRIGNGSKVHIWKCKWLPRPRTFEVMSPPINLHRDTLVSSLIDSSTGCWNQDLIAANFWEEDAKLICAIPLGSFQNEDKLIWHYTNNGVFSVRSAYHLARDLKREEEEQRNGSTSSFERKDWRWLWHVKMPNKIKIFVWRAIKNSLPVSANLIKRRVPISHGCPVCSQNDETVLHALFLCYWARQVWAVSGISWSVYGDCGNSIEDWFIKVRQKTDTKELGLFWAICWAIWHNRNRVRVGENCQEASSVSDSMRKYLESVSTANEITHPIIHCTQVSHWIPPPPGSVKINFDGALSTTNGKTALGIIARDSSGTCVGWLSETLNLLLAPVDAEATAAAKAMVFALNSGWDDIILEGDSKIVIDRILDQKDFLGGFGNQIADIKRISANFQSFQARHTPRNGNAAADSLAKFALSSSLSSPLDNSTLPSITMNIVLNDLSAI